MSFANTILYARATPSIGSGEVEEEIVDGDSEENQALLEKLFKDEERRG